MKEFNTTGLCNPKKHYMVDISNKLDDIKKLVNANKTWLFALIIILEINV